jgi:hypothetical protein
MKKIVLPIAIVAMMLLLAAAYTWDSVRSAASARDRVLVADGEMRKHERRLEKLLADSPKAPTEVQSALATYRAAGDANTRRDAYGQLVSSIQKSMSRGLDPTNPLDRKFMDEIAGAINRREVAQKQFDEESTAYEQLLASFRGRVAQVFSAKHRGGLAAESGE